MQMSAMEDVSLFFPVDTYPSYKYLLLLTILENHQGKMIEMVRINEIYNSEETLPTYVPKNFSWTFIFVMKTY